MKTKDIIGERTEKEDVTEFIIRILRDYKRTRAIAFWTENPERGGY